MLHDQAFSMQVVAVGSKGSKPFTAFNGTISLDFLEETVTLDDPKITLTTGEGSKTFKIVGSSGEFLLNVEASLGAVKGNTKIKYGASYLSLEKLTEVVYSAYTDRYVWNEKKNMKLKIALKNVAVSADQTNFSFETVGETADASGSYNLTYVGIHSQNDPPPECTIVEASLSLRPLQVLTRTSNKYELPFSPSRGFFDGVGGYGSYEAFILSLFAGHVGTTGTARNDLSYCESGRRSPRLYSVDVDEIQNDFENYGVRKRILLAGAVPIFGKDVKYLPTPELNAPFVLPNTIVQEIDGYKVIWSFGVAPYRILKSPRL
jgi:hypothetical protein